MNDERPQRDLDPAALGRRSSPARRQGAGDVGEQPTGDQDAARLVDVGRHVHAAGHLVVEARQRQAVGGGLDQQPASTGIDGRDGSVRAAQATASARTSRSSRNFTSVTPVGLRASGSSAGTTTRRRWRVTSTDLPRWHDGTPIGAHGSAVHAVRPSAGRVVRPGRPVVEVAARSCTASRGLRLSRSS